MSKSSKKEEKKTGLWAYLTQICRKPNPYDVLIELAKADLLLMRLEKIYERNDSFERETERIEYLKSIIATTKPIDREHELAKKELNKILRL